MKLNDAQFKAVAPYEPFMRSALYQRWSRNPGRRALELMAQIYREAAHLRVFSMDYNCSACIVNLLADVGRLYFADKEEKEAEAAAKKAAAAEKKKKVATTKKAKAPEAPVEVKTEETADPDEA